MAGASVVVLTLSDNEYWDDVPVVAKRRMSELEAARKRIAELEGKDKP